MGWTRLGRVWGPDGSLAWSRSHASHPTPVALGGDAFRIFFDTRDGDDRSSIGRVDVVIGETMSVTAVGDRPLLEPGGAGAFDDSGIGLGSIVRPDTGKAGEDRLYYMGWNLGVLAPWRNSIGVATGDAAAPAFAKPYLGPILDRSIHDPYTLSYPWVMKFADDDWRMWYGSNLAWGAASADMQHVIKRARSSDGLTWRTDATPALGFADVSEYAMARPTVIRDEGGFAMWFATRGDHYRIGAAFSADGETWVRRDASHGLDRAGGGGFDDEMTCYPCVFEHQGRRLMLYNGNGYGRDGFALAEWTAA